MTSDIADRLEALVDELLSRLKKTDEERERLVLERETLLAEQQRIRSELDRILAKLESLEKGLE